MQIPTSEMSSERLYQLGLFFVAASAQTPRTRALGAAFQPHADAVKKAQRKREDAEEALIAPRVAMRFSEYALEQALRRAYYDASAADGKGNGPVLGAVFPDGLDREIRPRGAAQLETAGAVRTRIDKQPAATPLRAEHLPALDAGIEGLRTNLAARKKAWETLALARAEEDAARETFVQAYDGSAGAIRQLFPRDRAQQNLYFDTFRSSEKDEEALPAEAPAAGPADQ